jgi:predicted unusual protein kinase regulating ubiquinone biosynthesis (AarF/ABC1/UbiB family)
VKGQSRLQGYRVIQREAQMIPQAAQLVEDILEFGERIGGGSLVTVYEVTLRDGRKQAVSVRNPNVEYHLSKTVNLLRATFEEAQKKNPDDRNYQLMGILLDDVEQWILDELNDPRFEEKDLKFRFQNDTRYGEFKQGNSKYGVMVPESIPTGTRWLRREEYIAGQNFTSLQPVDGPSDIMNGLINKDDLKDATSTLVRNYMYQMLKTGLVHSDVHPGNFRITADNKKIAIFDRYNLLELDKTDKQFIKGLVGAFMTQGAEGVGRSFLDYVFTLDQNKQFLDQRDVLLTHAKELFKKEAPEQSVIDCIIMLKQKGIKVPLKTALIGKNLQSLNRMSQEAGFGNLAEAYLHSGSKLEFGSLLMFG